MQKRLFLLFCLIPALLLGALFPAFADDSTPSLDEAEALLFLHLQSETEILSKNANILIRAGATVKTMSGLLLCELFANRTSEQITVTSQMVSGAGGLRYGFSAGDSVSVLDLLYAAICGGYNDAYRILVYSISEGAPQRFLDRMNERAKSVGALNTYFSDYTGLEDSSVTTASDLMKIALSAYQNDFYLGIASTSSYTVAGKKFSNRNGLISSSKYYLAGCLGLSAGTTNGSDALVAIANRDGEGYACVALGCAPGSNNHYTLANRLYKWAYSSHTHVKIVDKKDVICEIPVTVSDQVSTLPVKTDESFSAYLPVGAEVGKDVRLSVRLNKTTLEAPVEDHTFVGYLAIQYNGSNLATLSLYTAGSAERSNLISRILRIKNLTESRRARATLGFFLVAMAAWIGFEFFLSYRRRHKWDKYYSEKTEYDIHKQNRQQK